jgi:drug/metabolite transporter (DMT)-like permease
MNIQTPGTVHAAGREKLRGHLAALLFAVIIAGSFSLGGKAAPFMDPAALNAIRFAIATTAMAAFIYFLRGVPPRAPAAPWRFAILGALFAVYFITMFIALRLSQPVSTSAVFTLIPLMSAGFGLLFLGQKTRPVVLASLLIAACGSIWVIFRGNPAAILNFEIGRGEAIFLIGCACHAAFAPLIRLYQRDEHPLDFTFWILVATTGFLTLFGLPSLVESGFSAVPSIVWIAILYLAIFATATTTFLIRYAAVRLPASKVLAYGYLTPVFVILLEGITGYGWATTSVFAGAIVIGAALLVMALAPDA